MNTAEVSDVDIKNVPELVRSQGKSRLLVEQIRATLGTCR